MNFKYSTNILIIFFVYSLGSILLNAMEKNKDTEEKSAQLELMLSLQQQCYSKWCLGDYFFQFEEIDCDSSNEKCELELQALDNSYESPEFIMDINCSIEDIKSIKSELSWDSYNEQFEASENVIEQIDLCITEWEEFLEIKP